MRIWPSVKEPYADSKEPETPVKDNFVPVPYDEIVKDIKPKKRTTMAKNKYLVLYADKDNITVYADKVGHGDGLYFWAKKRDVLNEFDLVAHFPAGTAFTLVDDGDPRPAPVPGVEYYSLEDLRRALKETDYYLADDLVDKIRRQLSVRDDGRYTIDELKTAVSQVKNTSGLGGYYTKLLDAAALQARKNRVFDAHTR